MACLNPDGTLTKPAIAILNAMKTSPSAEGIAKTTGFPVYRVRSVLRELTDGGLAVETNGEYTPSELGLKKL